MPSSSLRAPFRNPDFRMLWTGVLISNLGAQIQAVGAGWTMASITTSDAMVALVQAAMTVPIMLFSLASGAIADGYDRRRVMLAAQVLMMAASIALALIAAFGFVTPWGLLAFTFLIGCGTALHNPSWQASMGDLASREHIAAAVTLNSMAFNLTRSVGPAIGGVIVAAVGAAVAFAVNAFAYIPLIASLLVWKPRVVPARLPREPFGHAVGAGLRYVGMSPNLVTVISRSTIFGFSAVAVLALLPLVARDFVAGNAATFGLLLGSFGIGAIGGALANSRLRDAFDSETIARMAFLGMAVGVGVVLVSRHAALTSLGLLPAGAAWVLALSLFNVTVQLSTPRWVVGRALSIYQMATFGGMTAGAWLWGVVADGHGLATALAGAAAVLLLGAAIGLRFPLPGLVVLNLDPHGEFQEPTLQLDLRPRSGPIMVMVDYDIAQHDVPDFLAAMSERRRTRIRNGARQWALLRDLENPGTWTESYHVPTWVEYIRHNTRQTKADAEVSARLRALHRGEERPRVHRMIERQTVPRFDDLPIRGSTDVH